MGVEKSEKKETPKSLRKKLDFQYTEEEKTEWKKRELNNLEKRTTRNLLEQRDYLRDIAPGVDMDALDKSLKSIQMKPMRQVSFIRSLNQDFTNMPPNAEGVAKMNRYFKQGMHEEVAQILFDNDMADHGMDDLRMPLGLRELATENMAKLNRVKVMKMAGPEENYRLIVTDENGQRVVNEVFQQTK